MIVPFRVVSYVVVSRRTAIVKVFRPSAFDAKLSELRPKGLG